MNYCVQFHGLHFKMNVCKFSYVKMRAIRTGRRSGSLSVAEGHGVVESLELLSGSVGAVSAGGGEGHTGGLTKCRLPGDCADGVTQSC